MKIVPADVGPIEVKGPRDTAGVFEPQMVKKRRQQRRTCLDEGVLSLSAQERRPADSGRESTTHGPPEAGQRSASVRALAGPADGGQAWKDVPGQCRQGEGQQERDQKEEDHGLQQLTQ